MNRRHIALNVFAISRTPGHGLLAVGAVVFNPRNGEAGGPFRELERIIDPGSRPFAVDRDGLLDHVGLERLGELLEPGSDSVCKEQAMYDLLSLYRRHDVADLPPFVWARHDTLRHLEEAMRATGHDVPWLRDPSTVCTPATVEQLLEVAYPPVVAGVLLAEAENATDPAVDEPLRGAYTLARFVCSAVQVLRGDRDIEWMLGRTNRGGV